MAQPLSAASCVAYIAAGWWLWRRAASPRHRSPLAVAYALAVTGNGLGGAAFHARGDALSRAVHDLALVATVGGTAALAVDRRPAAGPAALTGAVLAAAAAANLSARTTSAIRVPAAAPWGHAVWHLLTAAALAAWGRASEPRGRRGETGDRRRDVCR